MYTVYVQPQLMYTATMAYVYLYRCMFSQAPIQWMQWLNTVTPPPNPS